MNNRSFTLRTMPLLLGLMLAACGGGGGDASPAPIPESLTLTLSGTAATGAAIASAPVEVRCDRGTGSATSRADGGFDVTVSSGRLPCVLRVTAPGGTVLHSVAIGSGTSARANISPLTDLAVAHLAGAAPSTLWDNLAVDRLTTTQVDRAISSVLATVAGAGINTAAIGNPFTAALVPPSGTTPGNAYDQALDALQAALVAAGSSLTELRERVIASAPSAPPSPSIGVPSLPPELLLAASASNCNSLRTGRYRILLAAPSGQIGQHFVVEGRIDAAALTFDDDDPTEPLTNLVPAGNCRYNVPNGQLVMGPAGVGLVRSAENGVARLGVVIPVQSHALSDLAGAWNAISLYPEGGLMAASRGNFSLAADGRFTALEWCEPFDACQVDTPEERALVTLSARADGGFNIRDTRDGPTDRMYGFRSGGGALVVIGINENGELLFLNRRNPISMPAVGRVTENWGLDLTGALQAAANITDSRNTVLSVDTNSTPQTFQRSRVINFGTGATVTETMAINSPDTGYLTRRPATGVTASDGSTVNVSGFTGLSLTGTGLFPLWLPALNRASVSLNIPAAP